jgi:hypothetical protein
MLGAPLRARLRGVEASGDRCPPWGLTFQPDDIDAIAAFMEEMGQITTSQEALEKAAATAPPP